MQLYFGKSKIIYKIADTPPETGIVKGYVYKLLYNVESFYLTYGNNLVTKDIQEEVNYFQSWLCLITTKYISDTPIQNDQKITFMVRTLFMLSISTIINLLWRQTLIRCASMRICFPFLLSVYV